MKTENELFKEYGTVYNIEQVQKVFQIEGFLAPFCTAIERSTLKKCVLQFQHDPRFYWFVRYTD